MRAPRLLYAIGLLSIFIYGCQKNSIGVEKNYDESVSFPGGIEAPATISAAAAATPINKTYLLQMVNDVRTKGCNCGGTYMPPVAPLKWDTQLETAAYNHSNDMFTNNYFSHYGQNGSTPATRVKQAGYLYRALGENIARGYPNEQSVINGWLNSPGHCRNLMNSRFKDMAISRVGSYWTQELGTRY